MADLENGMREVVKNFDPRGYNSRVFTVWREEQYEGRTLIGVAGSIEVGKVIAENEANKHNWSLMWRTATVPVIDEDKIEEVVFYVADVDDLISYTVWEEKVHHLAVKDPPPPMPPAPKEYDFLPSSKYGIICPNCGPQGMTREEYMAQLSNADARWKCIHCGGEAEFDQCRYEAGGL